MELLAILFQKNNFCESWGGKKEPVSRAGREKRCRGHHTLSGGRRLGPRLAEPPQHLAAPFSSTTRLYLNPHRALQGEHPARGKAATTKVLIAAARESRSRGNHRPRRGKGTCQVFFPGSMKGKIKHIHFLGWLRTAEVTAQAFSWRSLRFSPRAKAAMKAPTDPRTRLDHRGSPSPAGTALSQR